MRVQPKPRLTAVTSHDDQPCVTPACSDANPNDGPASRRASSVCQVRRNGENGCHAPDKDGTRDREQTPSATTASLSGAPPTEGEAAAKPAAVEAAAGNSSA